MRTRIPYAWRLSTWADLELTIRNSCCCYDCVSFLDVHCPAITCRKHAMIVGPVPDTPPSIVTWRDFLSPDDTSCPTGSYSPQSLWVAESQCFLSYTSRHCSAWSSLRVLHCRASHCAAAATLIARHLRHAAARTAAAVTARQHWSSLLLISAMNSMSCGNERLVRNSN